MHGRRVKRAGMGGARHRNSDHKDRHRISVRTDSRRSSCGCGANLRKLGLNGVFSKSATADVQRLKFFVRRCAPRAVVFLYSKRGSRCMAENFYQLALRTPGIWPLYASSRKQIRQMPYFLRYACGRPQILQRLYSLVENFAGRCCLIFIEVLAMDKSS